MNWLLALFSGDETRANAVITTGILSLLGLVGYSGYAIYEAPATWNPVSFAGGAGTIIAAIGAGKGIHDRLQQGPQQ